MVISDKVVKKGHCDRVTFKERLEGSEEMTVHVFLAKEYSKNCSQNTLKKHIIIFNNSLSFHNTDVP